MGDEGPGRFNSELVRYLLALHKLHNAEFGSEDAFTNYHLIQEENGRYSSITGIGPALPALGHALAGSIATASAKTLLYPLNLVITRLQVQKQLRHKGEAEHAAQDAAKEYAGIIDAARKIWKTEGGLKAFYTGCPPDIGKGILDSFLFFLLYTFLRQYEMKRNGIKHLPIGKELGVGIAAGSLAKFVTTPIENIVTRQQTAALVAARDPNSGSSPGESDKASVRDIARQIHSERGLAGFWSGYSESVVLTINPAITFAVDNILMRLLPEPQRGNPSPQVRFLVAALSKAIATTATYPAMLAKSRAQVSGGLGSEEEESMTGSAPEILNKADLESTPTRRKAKSLIQQLASLFAPQYAMLIALRKIYRDEGLSGLYAGIEGEVLKGFLQHGLTMMTKEKAHVAVIQTYYLLLKATKKWPEEFQKASEGAKDIASDAQRRVGNVGGSVSEGAKSVASDAQERVVNVGETVSEGAKRMVEKASGTEKK